MEKILYISILLVLSCNEQIKKTEKQLNIATASAHLTNDKTDKSKFYTNQDTLVIVTENFDTLRYLKEDFNEIIENFPALYSGSILNPGLNYSRLKAWKYIIDEIGNKKNISFGSETGQNEYYILYAYFLKQKNGEKKYYELRKRLIDIYLNINSLFSHFE